MSEAPRSVPDRRLRRLQRRPEVASLRRLRAANRSRRDKNTRSFSARGLKPIPEQGGFGRDSGLLCQEPRSVPGTPSLRRLPTRGEGCFAQEAPSPQRRSREARPLTFLGEVTLPLRESGDFDKDSGFLEREIEDMLLGEVSHANEPRSGPVELRVGVAVALFVRHDAIS